MLSHPGTLIVVDNVVRNGKVLDASSTDPDIQGVRNFNAAVAAEPRVSATEIQTVGSKGYDGFALVLVLTRRSLHPTGASGRTLGFTPRGGLDWRLRLGLIEPALSRLEKSES